MKKKFMIGDIVECIDNDDIENDALELGNTYEILDISGSDIYLNDDNGDESWYYYRKFALIERTEPITESYFLDCFQRNFSDGGL